MPLLSGHSAHPDQDGDGAINAFGWAAPGWPAPPNVHALVTTRDGPESTRQSPFGFNVGTRCGDDSNTVAENRALLREALSLPSDPRWLRQVHGTQVAIEPAHDEVEADAAVTRTHR